MRKIVFITILILLGAASAGGLHAQAPTVREIPFTGEMVFSKLSPDGRTIAVYENANIHDNYQVIDAYLPVRLIDLESGSARTLTGPTDYACDAAFSADGATLASYHWNGYIFVWNVAEETEITRIPALVGQARIALFPNGKTLAVLMGGVQSQILVWDIESGAITAVLTERSETYAEYLDEKLSKRLNDIYIGIAVSPDGRTIAVATTYNEIKLWDVATGQFTRLRPTDADKPLLDVPGVSFTAGGESVVFFDRRAQILYFWDIATARETAAIELPSRSIPALSPDGSRIAWVDRETAMIHVASITGGVLGTAQDIALPLTENREVPPAGMFSSLAFTPDGSQLIFSGYWAKDGIGANALLVIDLGI